MIFAKAGKIAAGDATVKTRKGLLPSQSYTVDLKGGKKYRLTLESDEIDAVLVVQDKAGRELAYDEDGVFADSPAKDGTYVVVAASSQGTGACVLKIVEKMDGQVQTTVGSLPCWRFEVPLQGGKKYVLTMDSEKLDSFLVLQDKTGQELASDKGSGGVPPSGIERAFGRPKRHCPGV